MRICILGAGVIGLTTAWELAEQGHEIAIVDRHREPAAEASFANGAQLSYAFVAPLASPETLSKLPRLIFSAAAPIRIKPSYDPALIRWGLSFIAACNDKMVEETTRAQLALSALSQLALYDMVSKESLSFGLHTAGKLVVYRNAQEFEHAKAQVERQAQVYDRKQELLSPEACLALEPALKINPEKFVGGIFTSSEQVGDCLSFCRELSDCLRRRSNVTWSLGTHVRRLIVRGDRVCALDTSQGEIETDFVILATGAGGPQLARDAGFHLPIYPMKGYSITARPSPASVPLSHSVTDLGRKIVYAPLREDGTDVVRVAGIADLVGYDRKIDERRLSAMTRHAADMLHIDIESDVRPWAGLRPVTPDSRPIIGKSPLANLFLNTGHGALGWTLACGSARLTAQLIDGATPDVNPEWFSLTRVTS